MIIGIGTDIVRVERIRRLLDRYPGFVEKVFTEDEISYCSAKTAPAQSYAVRFAAKEAVMKALGTGWDGHINWRDIEVRSKDTGKPEISLYNGSRELAKRLGVDNILISLSHEKEYALAFAVLECQKA